MDAPPQPSKKRPSESAGDGGAAEEAPSAKRSRVEEGGGGAAGGSGAATAGAPKPAVSLAALEKAKKALELQKALKAKMAGLATAGPASVAAPGAAATAAAKAAAAAAALAAARGATAAPATAPARAPRPPPLVLDDQGRDVGARPPPPPPLPPARAPPPPPSAFVDPSLSRLGFGTAAKAGRGRGGALGGLGGRGRGQTAKPFEWAVPGAAAAAAAAARRAAAAGAPASAARAGAAAAAAVTREAAALAEAEEAGGGAPPPPPPPPAVEWWDGRMLTDPGAGLTPANLNARRLTGLVEHPVPLPPAFVAPPPPAQPLRLTPAERRKLRTRRRAAREAERQTLVRQGLLPPPPPKVRLSNLARVLGADGAADPTAVEAEVRRQMAERAAAHEDRNLANALTPAERRAKKAAKLAAAGAAAPDGTVGVAVYGIAGPALATSNKLKFKVRANATELHLAGAAAATPAHACVVVEGGAAALRKFKRLMTARIDWSSPDGSATGVEAGVDPPDGWAPSRCVVAWEGHVARPAWARLPAGGEDAPQQKPFSLGVFAGPASARAAMAGAGVPQYWDLAVAAVGGATAAAPAVAGGGGGGG